MQLGSHLGGHFESDVGRHIGLYERLVVLVFLIMSTIVLFTNSIRHIGLACRLLPFIGRFVHNFIPREPSWRPFWKRLWAPYWLKWQMCCLRVPKHVSDCSFYQIYVILAFTGRLFSIYWQICVWFDTSAAILVAILKEIMGAILAQMIDWLSSCPYICQLSFLLPKQFDISPQRQIFHYSLADLCIIWYLGILAAI